MASIFKIILKLLLRLLVLIIILFVGFYFWAGSPTLQSEDYYRIKPYDSNNILQSDTIKIMTYNVGYLSGMTNNLPVDRPLDLVEHNMVNCLSFLDSVNADIIAFQEIDFDADRSYNINQLNSFSTVSNYSNGAIAVNWDKSYVPFPYWPIKHQFGKIISGQAILSKIPIVDQTIKILDKPLTAPFYYNKFYLDRLVQVAFLKVNLHDTLVVMNTHLEAFDLSTRVRQVGVVSEMFKKYSSSFPTILLGDFNSRPPFSLIDNPIDSTLADIYKLEGIKEVISRGDYLANEDWFYTFDTAKPYERLDYIFYSDKYITKLEGGVAHQAGNISDHYPVWMTFTLKK